MRIRTTTLGALASALLAACSADSPVTPSSSLAPGIGAEAAGGGASRPVPFKAGVTGSVTIGTGPTNCPAGTVPGSATGGGTATQLGAFRIVSQTACLNADGTGGTQGEFVWRAANGDLLAGTFTFTATPPDANGTVTLTSLTGAITGGRGRFAGASGPVGLEAGTFQFVDATHFNFRVGVVGRLTY